MRGWRLLFEAPVFGRLWFAEAISQLGDWCSVAAVGVLAAGSGRADDAWAVALVLLARIAPEALAQPIAGSLADRFDRRHLLIGVATVQAMLTLSLLAATHSPTVLAVLLAVRAAVTAVDQPARAGAIQASVAVDRLVDAHTFSGATWSAVFAGGMALGGALATVDPRIGLLADAASFGGAALLAVGLPPLPPGGARGPSESAPLAALRSDPLLVRAAFAKTPIALAGGAGLVWLYLLAPRLGTAGLAFGALQAIKGLGTGVGPWLAEVGRGRGFGEPAAANAARVATLSGVGALAALPGLFPALGAAFIWGLGSGTNWVLSTAAVQGRAPAAVVGRITALDWFGVIAGTSVSVVVGAATAEWSGRPELAAIAGVCLGLLGLAAGGLLP